MPEPNEPLKGLVVPNTGDLVGAWGTSALNANFQAIGGMMGGVVTISPSGATTIALSVPSGSITPGAGPNQSQNAMIRVSGSLTGNCFLQFTLPGQIIIDHQATVGSFFVQVGPSAGTGTSCGVPPGKKTMFFYDGVNVDYVNPPDPGTAIDLHGATTIPLWMLATTKQYALVKDGSSFSTAAFPALFNAINYAFGGAGASFNVPDERARMRLALDTGGTGRVTAGGSGVDATTMGATGGSQLAQQHAHSGSGNVSDPGHGHNFQLSSSVGGASGNIPAGSSRAADTSNGSSVNAAGTGITVPSLNINASGSGNSQNMPPTIVSFLALIKT